MSQELRAAVIESLTLLQMLKTAPAKIEVNHITAFLAVLEGEGVAPDQVRQGAIKLLKSETFFPAPAQLLEAIKGSGKDDREISATLAWEKVREQVRKLGSLKSWFVEDLGGDGAALWAVECIGLQELNDMTSENRTWLERDFKKLYVAALSKGNFARHIPGNLEIDNKRRGLPIMRPSMLGRNDLLELPPTHSIEQGAKALEVKNA